MSSLSLQNIKHRFDNKNTVLDDISLSINDGEIACLVGPSGCGKSTLLRIIAGIEKISHGKVMMDNKNYNKVDIAKRSIGLVFQHPSLFPHLTVEENLKIAIPKNTTQPPSEIIDELLESMHITDKRNCYPSELSGGQQQRVSIARACASQPKLMLLDEAFANLDVVLRKKVLNDTIKLLQKNKITTLLVTHDPEEAIAASDKIFVMEKGKVTHSGNSSDIYKNPNTLFAASLFGEPNILKYKVENKKIESDFGIIKTSNFIDGEHINLLIREEFIKICKRKTKKSLKAVVENTRFIGSCSIIYLRLDKSSVALHTRIYDNNVPNIGSEVFIEIEPPLLFGN